MAYRQEVFITLFVKNTLISVYTHKQLHIPNYLPTIAAAKRHVSLSVMMKPPKFAVSPPL